MFEVKKNHSLNTNSKNDDEVVFHDEYNRYGNGSHQLIIILFDKSVLPLSTCFWRFCKDLNQIKMKQYEICVNTHIHAFIRIYIRPHMLAANIENE